MNQLLKYVKNNWFRFASICVFWTVLFLVIYHTPVRGWIRSVTAEARLGFLCTIFTAVLTEFSNQQKKRTERLIKEQEITQQIQKSNQETFISSIRVLEDTIDAIRLDLREFQVINTRMGAIESEMVKQKSDHCSLIAEVKRQDEKLRQGDRLLATLNLMGGLINDVAELRTTIGMQDYPSSVDYLKIDKQIECLKNVDAKE